MDTDLEQIIKDTTVVLTPGHIKAYTLMTLQGLEYLHLLWILHRVIKNLISVVIISYFISNTLL